MFHSPFKSIRELKSELNDVYATLRIKEKRIEELEVEDGRNYKMVWHLQAW